MGFLLDRSHSSFLSMLQGCDNMSVVIVVLKPFAEQILSKQAQQQKADDKKAP